MVIEPLVATTNRQRRTIPADIARIPSSPTTHPDDDGDRSGQCKAMDAYEHLRTLISLILGLSITRVLSGLSHLLQEPVTTSRMKSRFVWSLVLLLNAIHFWWWEFALRLVKDWNFWIYTFVLSYASLIFLMSTFVDPDHIRKYDGQEQFFIRRRHAFFALFTLSFAFDVVDTLIKGVDYFHQLGDWYLVRTIVGAIIAIVAMRTVDSRRVMYLGLVWFICDILWITKQYSVLH